MKRILIAMLLALMLVVGMAGAVNVGQIILQTVPAAESSDDDQLFAYGTGHCNQSTNIAKVAFLAQPDVCRNLIYTFNATTTGTIRINGTDYDDAAIYENLTVSGASSGASTKAFKTVTRIAADLAAGQTNKTLKMGTGDLLGLSMKYPLNTFLFDLVGSTRDTNAPTVTVSSTVKSLNTIDTSTAPGGSATTVAFVATAGTSG